MNPLPGDARRLTDEAHDEEAANANQRSHTGHLNAKELLQLAGVCDWAEVLGG